MSRKKTFQVFIVFSLLFFSATLLNAQDLDLTRFNENRIQLNKTGMTILMGWAATNLAVGAYGNFQKSGQTKYFHQMNAMWNTVNLGIGIFGYLGLTSQNPEALTFAETLKESMNFEKILLFNAGLDIGYMAMGGILWERGLRKVNDRFIGYGKSLILQGGFLFAFDAVLFYLNQQHNQELINILSNVTLSPSGVQISIPF